MFRDANLLTDPDGKYLDHCGIRSDRNAISSNKQSYCNFDGLCHCVQHRHNHSQQYIHSKFLDRAFGLHDLHTVKRSDSADEFFNE